MVPLFAADVAVLSAEAIDLSDATERTFQTPDQSTPGGTPGVAPTLAACIMIRHKIGVRYRGGHPRTYLPPSAVINTTDGDNWQAGFVTTVTTNWTAYTSGLQADLNSAGVLTNVQVVPQYTYSYTADATKHKFIKQRQGYKGTQPVLSFQVDKSIRSQRRRLGK
jgi:hypothetical protein